MGCCDSSHPVIAPAQVHRKHNVLSGEQEQEEKKQLSFCENKESQDGRQVNYKVKINPESYKVGNEVDTLEGELTDALNSYEQHHGIMSEVSFPLPTERQEPGIQFFPSIPEEITEQEPQLMIETPDMRSIINDGTSLSNSTSAISSTNNILLNTSLNSYYQRKKQNFYDGSAFVNGVNYGKWKDGNRFPIKFPASFLQYVLNGEIHIQYFCSLAIICQYYEKKGIYLMAGDEQKKGIRVFINGTKRLFPVKGKLTSQNGYSAIQQFLNNINQKREVRPCYAIHHLTGWIPEIINLQEVQDQQGIFDRIASNFSEDNIMIVFSNSKGEKIVLSEVCQEDRVVKGYSESLNSYEQVKIEWNQIIRTHSLVQVNWNPSIYDISFKFQLTLNADSTEIEKKSQILIKIPSNDRDLELRILIEKHCSQFDENNEITFLELFDYNGKRITDQEDPIRSNMFTNFHICSEVYVFEAADETSQYILALKPCKSQKKDTKLTIQLFSFSHVSAKVLPQEQVIEQMAKDVILNPSNVGYGINSPFFTRNLHFSLSVSLHSNIRIETQAPSNHRYEICLVNDPNARKDISQIDIQQMMEGIQQSSQIRGKGMFEIRTNFENYLLILMSYTETSGSIKIKIKNIWKEQMGFDHQLKFPQKIKLQEIIFNPDIIFQANIKWNQFDSGPRKRYKENSNSNFQPGKTFAQYFKNPFLDKKIQKGRYQFSINSQTHKAFFVNLLVSVSEENSMMDELIKAEAPTLSMSIFEAENGKYKIILDDAFYVPFGMGFWSDIYELEEANYRFVFPKLEKDNSIGTFLIRKLS